MLDTIYTIGHSTHPLERFLALLRQHGITAVCDVRSTPYSRMNPQFNRETLEGALKEHGIEYRFLGKELSARSADPSCHEAGRVQYGRLAETELFQQGLKRVLRGAAEGLRIALMCAEREPLKCHRTILVSRRLAAVGVPIAHVHADGRLESHEAASIRLAATLNVPGEDMFRTRDDVLEDAYRRQEERIAYRTK